MHLFLRVGTSPDRKLGRKRSLVPLGGCVHSPLGFPWCKALHGYRPYGSQLNDRRGERPRFLHQVYSLLQKRDLR